MKQIVLYITATIIVCISLISCGSKNDLLSHFSKRKYLKKNQLVQVVAGNTIDKHKVSINNYSKDTISYKKRKGTVNCFECDKDEVYYPVLAELSEETITGTDVKEFSSSRSVENSNYVTNEKYSIEKLFKQQRRIYPIKEDSLPPKQFHWAAFVSLVTGVFGGPLAPIAIIFAIIAMYAINKEPDKYKGKGMAIAGIICAILLFSVFLKFVVFV